MLEGLKGIAPTRTSSPPHTSDNVISSQIDEEDWEIVNPHEADVFYHDRITLLLGPRQETRHQILLVDAPKSSELPNRLRMLAPSQRIMHLFFPDLPMVKSYLNSQSTSPDALAIEMSWLGIIKLSVTADVFQDTYIQDNALAALNQKAVLALSPGNAVSIFESDDFAFAYTCYTKTEGTKQKASSTKYGNSVLRGMGLSAAKKEGDGKVHPVRQPTVPPSAEALKRGNMDNFDRS
ncbi:hypothetical protein G6011_11416 [Alternaria panax]|uniref:Uncharacterized protein n=1 Tax=Alternaria panax TaxID=48097 RepID=A0AAD4NRR9_9PLEO|nr:hypothetical protein G6011_11416 [Alternaria panax]